ncbi:major facilitator superfamily transporter [Ceratobasidium sp. AG-Ba]|nr:major facilitator superfamily transporter [Ceratobasidium sp. AG-Ba]
MGTYDTPPPAVVEYAPADPSIVPAADAPLADPDVSPDLFGIAGQADDAEATVGRVARPVNQKPWYKTPSVWWLLPITAVSAMFRASTIAPRTELFIKFACDELRPEYRVDVSQWDGMTKYIDESSGLEVPITYLSDPVQKGTLKATLLHPDKRCIQDKEVHRAAAKLSAGITSAQGMLSVLTVGWWTQYSDRVGRTKLLAISAAAVLITDALLFLVAFRADLAPGGYRILVVGGAIDGLAGGFSAVVAAGHAYVTDCSSPLTRSRIFSFWTGVVYAGGALGPSLGSLLNRHTNDLLSTFYLCTALHIVYGFLVFFVVPESLSVEARAKAREAYEADMNSHSQSIFGSLWRLTGFVRPLAVFIPKRRRSEDGWRARDWSLTFVGIAAVGVALNTGSYHYKFQYALKTFHWSSIQLGYWLSLVGFWRAVHLTIVLPLILKGLYARRERIADSDHLSDEEKEAKVKKTDLLVVRASLLIDLVGYILLGIVTSQNPFIGASVVLSFGGGFAPANQSLALALAHPSAHAARRHASAGKLPAPAKREVGRLFGALAVIQALGSQVIGPAVFSATFVASIGSHPRTIFWLSGVIIILALGALSAVRLDVDNVGHPESPNEETQLLR